MFTQTAVEECVIDLMHVCNDVWLTFKLQSGTLTSHFLEHTSYLTGKNWDLTAALSDFEQLRQVHAGNLSCTFTEERDYPTVEKEMARTPRPLLHRQDDVVQGTQSNGKLLCMALTQFSSSLIIIFVNDLLEP